MLPPEKLLCGDHTLLPGRGQKFFWQRRFFPKIRILRRDVTLLRSHLQGISALWRGRDYCPKLRSLRVLGMATTGSNYPHNSCVPKTTPLSYKPLFTHSTDGELTTLKSCLLLMRTPLL